MRRNVAGQDLCRDIEEAHVGNVLRLDAFHSGEDDICADFDRNKVGIGATHGKLRDKAAVAAADLQFDGIAVSEQISVINKGTVRQRRFFQIFNRFPARNKERRACIHARFQVALSAHSHRQPPYFVPVEPKPPPPRTVAESSSASKNSAT